MWWYPAGSPLVLASRSPRRRAILEMIGIPFIQIPGNVRETWMDGSPGFIVQYWARKKAENILSSSTGDPVLGADTMVALGDELLGKPHDEDQAVNMLGRLSGEWHSVFGGVCVLWPEMGIDMQFIEETRVLFRNLGVDEIKAYISTGEPFDKAGAYGIQGYGSLLVERIEGCYFNVMGLPVSRLVHELRNRLLKENEA
ncbi:MAG: septum formation protein Maf [Candidatus Aegiribacteria sp.]|nr:septum formation protein Maf [Candidatus Aegiribacteria sp.]